MRIKRVLQGTALTALAAAAWVGAGSVDASAAISTTVDVANQKMTVTTGDKEVLFGVGTYNDKKSTVKVSAWDVHDVSNGEVTIDLSKLNNTKDNYVVVKTEKADPTYIKIPASVTKQKVTFNAGSNKLKIDGLKAGKVDINDAKTYDWEYRTSYGSWKDLNYSDSGTFFEDYQYQGASLYVRAKAASNSSITTAKGENNEDIKVVDADIKNATDDDKCTLYLAGNLPGKEAKLNIPAQKKGPSVSVDYLKSIVKLKGKTEYRVFIADADDNYTLKDTKPTKVADAGEEKEVKALLGAASKGAIEVRTSAVSDEAKFKGTVASKWTRIELEKTAALTAKSADTAILTTTGSGISAATQVADKVYMLGVNDKKGTYTKKVTVYNTNNFAINVKVDDVIKTVKAATFNADGTLKKEGSVSITNVEAGKAISIAKAGDKKNKVWAGEIYTPVGKVTE